MKAKSVSLIGASVAAIVGGSLFFFLPPNDILPEVTVEYSVPEETANVPAAVITQEKVVEEVPVEALPAVNYPSLYRPVITSPPLGLVSPSSSPAPLPPTPRKRERAILDGVDLSSLGDLLKGMSGGVGAKKLRDGSVDYRAKIGKRMELPVNWDRKLVRKLKKWNRRSRHDPCFDLSCRVSGSYNRRR